MSLKTSPPPVSSVSVDLPVANGGHCDGRTGTWTQTVETVSIHLSLSAIGVSGTPTVSFQSRRVVIEKDGVCVWSRDLEHAIRSSDCTWHLDDVYGTRYLCLHIVKAPPEKCFPGCEWWECVFIGDERIDTLTCSIGSDLSELPQQAVDHANREHVRFQSLSICEQQKELDYLSSVKKAFQESEEKTRSAAAVEEKAVAAVPERAEMLQALRNEFPHIDFTAK